MKVKSRELISHPSHYNDFPAQCAECGHRIECKEITDEMCFNLGNVVKYIWRADYKEDAVKDLKKAAEYIRFEIEKRLRKSKDIKHNRGKVIKSREGNDG